MARPHYAAKLGNQSQKGDQPSLFDVMAQESLLTSLKPALSHLLKFLAEVYPSRWSFMHKWSDELYSILTFLLESHYLKNYGASFSENFYGMKRVLYGSGSPLTSGKSRLFSLLSLTVWPYIVSKLESLYEQVKASLQSDSVHSLLLLLCGIRLERLTPQDVAAFSSLPIHLQDGGILTRLWRILLSFPGWCSRIFGYGLLLVQFIDLLYNSDLGGQLKKNNYSITKPPHQLLREEQVFTLGVSKCPLCFSPRKNDTVLSSSGYVFCYSCINGFVKKEGRCPVTGLPASTNQLIRLYISRT